MKRLLGVTLIIGCTFSQMMIAVGPASTSTAAAAMANSQTKQQEVQLIDSLMGAAMSYMNTVIRIKNESSIRNFVQQYIKGETVLSPISELLTDLEEPIKDLKTFNDPDFTKTHIFAVLVFYRILKIVPAYSLIFSLSSEQHIKYIRPIGDKIDQLLGEADDLFKKSYGYIPSKI